MEVSLENLLSMQVAMSIAYSQVRFIAGGNWSNGVRCGSRSVNVNNMPANRNSNNGCRLVSDTWKKFLPNPRLDMETFSKGKIQDGWSMELVGFGILARCRKFCFLNSLPSFNSLGIAE